MPDTPNPDGQDGKSSRPRLIALPAAAMALLYAALVERGVVVALSHLESPELEGTARALVFVLPPVAALLALWLGPLGQRSSEKPSFAAVLGRTMVAGAAAGALSTAVPIAIDLVAVARGGQSIQASDLSHFAYVLAGAVAGLALSVAAAAVMYTLLNIARAVARANVLFGALTALSLVVAGSLVATRPKPVSPDEKLAVRPTPPPGKSRGIGPPDESPLQKQKRRVSETLDELAAELKSDNPAEVERVILEANVHELLPDLFDAVVEQGLYDALEKRLKQLPLSSPALKALVDSRPTYGVDTLNADAVTSIKARRDWDKYKYSMLIVPGYTPVKARNPLPLERIEPAVLRLNLAIDDWKRGLAPYILVSGGSVHPAGTPHNEGLSMRDYLLSKGVPSEAVLVDPFARHSTTNLRNAGRMMRDFGMARAMIVTGFESSPFDQAFYFSHPVMSTFASRSRRELGFEVGELRGVDDHHIDFVPAAQVTTVNLYDPLDA